MRERVNLRIGLAQINSTLGDLNGNLNKIEEYIHKAKEFGVDIIVFPELAITGYPPLDLLFKPKFIEKNLKALKELVKKVGEIVVIVGFVDSRNDNLYNAAAIIYNQKIYGIYHKMLLHYGVFDEKRHFKPGSKPFVFGFKKCVFGVNISEDIWDKQATKAQASSGIELIFNINASFYHLGKIKEKEEIIRNKAKSNKVYIVYTNLVGGQDELIFDGCSMVVDKMGKTIAQAEAFKEDLLITDLKILVDKEKKGELITIPEEVVLKKQRKLPQRETKPLEMLAEIYQALLLGLRDYVAKNGFQKVVIGLSGGIDSSLVATLAVDALGKENVIGVFMPGAYSSQESEIYAKQLTENLGIRLINISIEKIYKVYLTSLAQFLGLERDITEENLQARIRGNILMALSNKFGWLVLTTGNKSEISTGYVTLYGDMAGGFAVIKDVFKTLVYKLAKYRNSLKPVIPEGVFTRPPSAELKPNQKDSDALPLYETLDPILKAYIEEDKDLTKIVSLGFDKEIVKKVLTMVDGSEYKRRQSPPGIKITPKAFEKRMPITNRYRD